MSIQEPNPESESGPKESDSKEIPPESQVVSSGEGEPDSLRRSSWSSSIEALDRLTSCLLNKELRLRESDRSTGVLLVLAIIAVISLIPFPSARGLILIGLDVISLFIIMFYLSNRLGLITTFSDRQTAVVGQIILGFVAFTIFLTLNAVAFINLLSEFVALH